MQSSFPALMFEMSAYTFLLEFIHSRGEQWSSGCLWPARLRFSGDRNKKVFSGTDFDWFEKFVGPMLPHYRQMGLPPITGRLGCSCEGGGYLPLVTISIRGS